MGIEAIGSGVASVASAVGRGASSVGQMSAEAGPVVGSIGRIVNEGPVASLEGFKPMGISDIGALDLTGGSYQPSFSLAGEILFKAGPQIKEADVVAEAESIIAQVPFLSSYEGEIATSVVSLLPRNDKLVEPAVAPVAIPNIVEYPQPQAVVLPESRVSVEVTPAVLTQPAVQEQETEEEIVTERVTAKQADIIEEREIQRQKKFVVDKPTLAQRLREVGPAVQKARLEAERLGYGKRIIGWILEKFIPLAHPEDLSQVVRPDGPDGTLSIIRETIKARIFNSPEEVKAVVLENRPISLEEEGEPVSDEEVRKVFQDRIVKPANKAMEIVEKRMVKKVQKLPDQSLVPTFVAEKNEAKAEITLRDLGLAEVFQKAAQS